MEKFQIRPHHGMCLAYFRGSGYSEEFVQNMTDIKEKLEKNPKIQLVDHADRICGSCPNNRENVCVTAEKVDRYDSAVLAFCGLKSGDELEWKAFEKLVREKILEPGHREAVCGDCEWNTLCK